MHTHLVAACLSLIAAPLALGCRDHAPPPAGADAAPSAVPRWYWLRDTTLLGQPGGSEERRVAGPALVELLPGGRVRSVAGAAETLDGYLPAAVLENPQEGRGLMLYAQREGELHFRSPAGPSMGLLHPGAFVSVVPDDGDRIAVGSLGYGTEAQPLAYVDRAILGIEPRTSVAPRRAGRGRSVLWPGLTFWFLDPATNKESGVSARHCDEIWFPEKGPPSQYFDGVELRGEMDPSDDGDYGPRVTITLNLCVARAVSRHAGRLFRTGPVPGVEVEIDAIPDSYRRVEVMREDPFLEALRKGAAVYWLVWDKERPYCSEQRLESAGRRITSRGATYLGRLHLLGGEAAFYPVEYEEARWNRPASLHLDGMHPNRWRTPIAYHYALLAGEGPELTMTGYEVPDNLVAFDPGDAERWFLSRPACEAALQGTVEALERDGSLAVRLGFHITED